jgi:hypothetical protein
MIYWVEQRLMDWGRFVVGDGIGGGYGGTFPAYQLIHVDSGGTYTMPISPDVLQIDKIMAPLKRSKPEWFEVAYWLYVSGSSCLYASERLKCNINTVYSRRDNLHLHVQNQINMRSIA